MELKFEEIYKEDPRETEGTNYVNYWSNANTDTTINTNTVNKKPKVSYDDILSSLNMVVSNGVLQFAKPTNSPSQQYIEEKPQQQKQQKQQQQKKTVTIAEPRFLPQNDYITNKYFKNYQQQDQNVEERRIPKTKEEYRQMLIEDYIKRQEAQRRISQIKSRKLLFDTRNIQISAPVQQMPRDMNKLFSTFKKG